MRSIILAAGKGTRLHSAEHNIPKVMHTVNGKPLLQVALETVDFVDKDDIYIVVGYKKEDIINHFGPEYNYVEQAEQKGTGHAVASASEFFKGYKGNVIVTYGDMPLFRKETLQKICKAHELYGADCTVMTAVNPDITSYGRVIKDENGRFVGIVEAKDCTEEQKKITELNSGVSVYNSEALFKVLPLLKNNNNQGEYYLTDVPALMMANGYKVELFQIEDGGEIVGVNTPEELEYAETILKNRKD